MALRDCIKKMEDAGAPISDDQVRALEEHIEAGLTDEQAIRAVALQAHQNVVDIANRATNEGAVLAPVSSPVSDLAQFQSKALQNLKLEQDAVMAEQLALSTEYIDAGSVVSYFTKLKPEGTIAELADAETHNDLVDDKVLMSLMLDFIHNRPDLREGGEILGLAGKDQFELFENFRKLEARQEEIRTALASNEKKRKRIEEQVGVIFHGKPGQTFYQSSPEAPKLTVLHNLSESNLEFTDKLGGLAVPSLAVMGEGAKFTGFGEITMIGTDILADPKTLPIFDADGYTVRFPPAEYPPVKTKPLDDLWNRVLPYTVKFELSSQLGYQLDEFKRTHRSPQVMMWHMLDSNAVKAQYLIEVLGQDLEATQKDIKPRYSWSHDDDVVAFFMDDRAERSWSWDDPDRIAYMKEAGVVVEAAMRRSVAKRMRLKPDHAKVDKYIEMSAMFNMLEGLTQMKFDEIRRDVRNKGKQEVDQLKIHEVIEARMSEGNTKNEFRQYVETTLKAISSEPRLKLNGKWVEYNLENIVRKMTAGQLKGAEFMDNMMNEGLMRALAAHRFTTLEQMRDRSQRIIQPADEVKLLREASQAKMLAWTSQLSPFDTLINEHGYVDAYRAADAARRAIVQWATKPGGMATVYDLEEAMIREGFDGVPTWLLDEGVDTAMTWLAVPVPYFEAKPQRAVKLEEFAGAVIPSDASPETRATLRKRGIPYKEYPVGDNIDQGQSRHDAVTEFTQQLNNQGERTLFQSEIGFTSGLLTGARTMPREKGTADDMLGTLKKQPNVRKQEIEAVALEEWAEAKGYFTRDELIAYLEAGGIVVKETYYGGTRDDVFPNLSWTPMEAPTDTIDETEIDDDGIYRGADPSLAWFDIVDSADQNLQRFEAYVDSDAGNVGVRTVEGEWLEIASAINNQDKSDIAIAIDLYLDKQSQPRGAAGLTRWTDYVLPGNAENHREVVLHLPEVGGYTFTMDDLSEQDHPNLLSEINTEREKAERESELFHYIDAVGPVFSPKDQARKVQTFQISKKSYPTIEEAKQYIIDEKPMDAPADQNYSSHAFPQANIMAWFRVNDRVGPNGERILFVEEIQSDLHQRGQKEGYQLGKKDPDIIAANAAVVAAAKAETPFFQKAEPVIERMLDIVYTDEAPRPEGDIRDPRVGRRTDVTYTRQEMRELLLKEISTQSDWLRNWERDWTWQIRIRQEAGTLGDIDPDFNRNFTSQEIGDVDAFREARVDTQNAMFELGDLVKDNARKIPDMPFKGDAWAALAMKRIIRLAAEGGYDQIAWTTGQQQNERYSLADHYSKVEYDPRNNTLVAYDLDGRIDSTNHVALDELDGAVGAEPALEIRAKIADAESHLSVESVNNADGMGTMIDPDDTFVRQEDREKLKDGISWVLIDSNGDIHRDMGGDYVIYDDQGQAYTERDDLIYQGDNLPTVSNLAAGEGKPMKQFYDSLLVNVTNKAVKALDKKAKVKRFGGGIMDQLHAMPVRAVQQSSMFAADSWTIELDSGSFLGDFMSKAEAEKYMRELKGTIGAKATGVHSLDITGDIIANALEGQTYMQDDQRASITFDTTNKAIVRLGQAKDLSSFLHEMAHLNLEMLGDLAEMPDATPAIIDDYAKMLNYLGVNSRREITTEHHELLARSFEAYLREGNAPTAELQPIFSEIKGWMIRVYSNLTKLLKPGEELTDEIRGVFDRLVASDEEIKQSEGYMGYVAMYQNAEEMGVTQRAFDVYRAEMEKSHNEAVDHESAKMIKAMHWGQQQWYRAELKKLEAEVRAEAEAMPVYQALAMLQKGKQPDGSDTPMAPFKLSKADLISRYGKDFMKRLPKPWVYTVEGGIDIDAAALVFGYKTGDELMQALVTAPKIDAFVKAEAKQRMDNIHPDPMNSPEMIDDAIRAVHNDKRGRIMAAELKALRNQQKADAKIVAATKKDIKEQERDTREAERGQLPTRENLAQIKAAAKQVISQKRIMDLNPNVYLQAERKAGRLAFEAMGRKDYAEAYAQKRKQIMNFEAYRAAVRAKAKTVTIQKYVKKFDRAPTRKRMGKAGVLEQIDAILENISFRNIPAKTIERINLEKELEPAIKAGQLIIPNEILRAMTHPDGINWKELTLEELEGIRDVIKQIEHQAVRDYKAIINGEEVIIQEAVDDVANSLIDNNKEIIPRRGSETVGEGASRAGRSAVGHWLRSSSIARILDKSGFGAVTRRIIIPIREAYTKKLLPRLQKSTEDVAAIYKKHYTNAEMGNLNKKLPNETMGEDMSKADILALALNWGSESNRIAVLGGVMEDVHGNKTPAYTEQQVADALSRLDARDWAFVQDVWDYQDTFYDEMAATERRRRGIAPKKIEALPFEITTSDGQTIQVRGGYHPLQYDPRHGGKTSATEFDEYFNSVLNGKYLSISTRAGSTYERTENHGRVVKLSLNTIEQNMRELLRDLSLGDEVNLVNRILQSDEVNRAARGTNNAEAIKELKLWLTDAAVGELPAQTIPEKIMSWVRVGFTKSKLAFNVYVTALQLTGVFQSMAVIGTASYARGFGKFMQAPVENYKMVMERSAFMNARYGILQTWDRDVADTNAFLKSNFGAAPTRASQAFDQMGHYYFYPIAKMQSVVDVTTWMGAYEKGLNEENLTEDQAVQFADAQVENAQTSGLFSDRSGIERGTLGTRTRQAQFVRLFTSLISYMLAKGNIAYEKGVRTDFRDPKQAMYFATDMLLLFTIEGIASSILYNRWPGDDDEDETVAGWTAKVTIESMAAGIPFARDYAAAKFGGGANPMSSLIVDMADFAEQVGQGDFDEAAIKSGVKVTGTMFHLPASQVNRAVEAFMSEDDVALYEYFTGKRDK